MILPSKLQRSSYDGLASQLIDLTIVDNGNFYLLVRL